MQSRTWAFAPLVVLLTAFRPAPAAACVCVGGPGLCRDAGSAAAVFEGTVEAIEPHSGPSIDGLPTQELHVRLRDVRGHRGTPQDVVVTDRGECGYRFVKGTRYLIVADRRQSDRPLIVSMCGLTRPLENAGGLVEYVNSLDAPGGRAQVFGTVRMPSRWVEFDVGYESLADARVTLRGPVTRSTITMADGRYRVTGLPPGKYRIRVELSSAFPYLGPVEDEVVRLDRQPHSCAAVDFYAPSRSHITGVVVDEHTRPQAGIFMMLHLADYHNPRTGDPGRGVTTDQDGRYTFSDLPPGRYVVGVSEPFSQAAARTEFGETIVALKRGEHTTMETLWVKRYFPGMLYGSIQTPSGDPVANLEVSLTPLVETTPAIANVPTRSDANGAFMLRGWLGERYRVVAGRPDNPSGQDEIVGGLGPLIIVVPPR